VAGLTAAAAEDAAAPVPVRRYGPKLPAYAGLVAAALLVGPVLGRPALLALVAPFAVALAAALAGGRAPRVEITLALDRDRAIEGDVVPVRLGLTAAGRVDKLDLVVPLPPGLAPADPTPAVAVALAGGDRREVERGVRCDRWGAYRLGEVVARAHDPLRVVTWEWRVPAAAQLTVFPPLERLRSLVRPFDTQLYAGNRVARQRGDGIELADVRPFLPGDRTRSINWRATARRGTPWVTERHPERNTDVVLFLDSFADVDDGAGGTLRRAVSAAAALAAGYLRERDRVGLVGFGGIVRWLVPSQGQAALYRLLDTLMETSVFSTAVWRDVKWVPPRVLPPKALLLALTPLNDDRIVAALLDLRARGYDLAIIDVSPVGVPAAANPAAGTGAARAVARRVGAALPAPPWRPRVEPMDGPAERLWVLEREVRRHHYERLGVAVVEWRHDDDVDRVLAEVELCRRRPAPARG
jgi:uncharacterized protein (DUF58 family)